MEIVSFFSRTFLFKEIDENTVKKILDLYPPKMVRYKRNETIVPFQDKMVGFLFSGQLNVIRDHVDGSPTVLNQLNVGDSFGILSVISNEEYSTKVYVSKNCEVLYFTDEQIMSFVNNYSQISMNLIEFLANRISFLNKKIETFSGSKVDNKLASFLVLESEKHQSLAFPLNHKKCSETINSGRASVYRSLASLESKGLIKVESKIIYISDPEGLERMSK